MKQKIKEYIGSLKDSFKFSKKDLALISVIIGAFGLFLFVGGEAMAQVSLPGEDKSSQLTMAGTTLRLVDTVLFKWVARILAGVFVLVCGVWLKDQRYSMAAMAFIAAVLMGTSSSWIDNIFSIGGDGEGGVFDTGHYIEQPIEDVRVV